MSLTYDEKLTILRGMSKTQLLRLAKDIGWDVPSFPWDSQDVLMAIHDMLVYRGDKVTQYRIDKACARPKKDDKKKTKTKNAIKKVKRETLTARDKEIILKVHNYRCAKRGEKLEGTIVFYDHRIPLALDGEDVIQNIQPLCGTCHAEKTRADRRAIAMAKKKKEEEELDAISIRRR